MMLRASSSLTFPILVFQNFLNFYGFWKSWRWLFYLVNFAFLCVAILFWVLLQLFKLLSFLCFLSYGCDCWYQSLHWQDLQGYVVKFLPLLKVKVSTILLSKFCLSMCHNGILGLTFTFQMSVISLFFNLWVWFLVSEPTLARSSRVFTKTWYFLSSHPKHMGGMNQTPPTWDFFPWVCRGK